MKHSFQLHNRQSDPSTLWIIHEDDPASTFDLVMAEQVTSEPPDNHLWIIATGTRQLVSRSDILESYKHIEIDIE